LFGILNKMVKSVYRAVKILDVLSSEGEKSVTEISRSLNFPKSSVHEIISTLLEAGILEKDSDRNRYSLGLKLFELGKQAQANLEISKVAIPSLRGLHAQLDETVHLTVLDGMEVLYIECFESTKRLRTYSVIGVRAPLHCTAVGKAILAYLDEREVDEVIQSMGLPRFTENTITDRQRLNAEMKNIRDCGFAIDDMEHEDGVRCVGAPVRNHTGKVVASISVSGPSQRMTSSRLGEFAPLVMERAAEISKRLGYKP
jgi:IclR family KDG regulon transcriptional repressor